MAVSVTVVGMHGMRIFLNGHIFFFFFFVVPTDCYGRICGIVGDNTSVSVYCTFRVLKNP